MTPAARIQAVIEIMAEILGTDRPADALSSAYFRNRRYIGSKDRQYVYGAVYQVIRSYHRLSWWVEKAGAAVTARSLVIASLLLSGAYGASTIGAMFSGEKFCPEPMTREEKRLGPFLEGKSLTDPAMPPRVRAECPEWALESLQKALAADFESEMAAALETAPLDIRVNALKANREDVLDMLKKEGFDAHPGEISPWCIRLYGRPQILQHRLFREGFFEVQDEGSQMIAEVAGAKPGEQVADFCAGAGGKTLALGADMKNKGRIVALDVLGRRLMQAKLRFRRAGLHNIETREISGENDKFVKRHQDHFDLVLVDAPCSGTGTWRRNPDARFRKLGPALPALLDMQKNILKSAARMVRPGGRIVYATCSLLKEENEEQISSFLKEAPEFSVSRIGGADYLKLTPARNGTDGFFAARLARREKAA